MASAFKRMQMAVQDKLRNHVKQVTEKLDAAGIQIQRVDDERDHPTYARTEATRAE